MSKFGNTQTISGSVYSTTGGYAGSYIGQATGGQWTYTPTYDVHLQCVLRMIVERGGAIRTWTYQGNDCDRLVVNPNAVANPVSVGIASNQLQSVTPCLEEQAKKLTESSNDFDYIKSEVREACKKATGIDAGVMAAYHARKALDAKSH